MQSEPNDNRSLRNFIPMESRWANTGAPISVGRPAHCRERVDGHAMRQRRA
jgi:hypothetical protein